jgi:hypothetical protein
VELRLEREAKLAEHRREAEGFEDIAYDPIGSSR